MRIISTVSDTRSHMILLTDRELRAMFGVMCDSIPQVGRGKRHFSESDWSKLEERCNLRNAFASTMLANGISFKEGV